jgi:hypothetical protein
MQPCRFLVAFLLTIAKRLAMIFLSDGDGASRAQKDDAMHTRYRLYRYAGYSVVMAWFFAGVR